MRKALGAAAVVLVSAAVIFNIMRGGDEPSRPQDAVFAVIDSARAGDVKGYLSGFSGGMRERLAEQAERDGEGRFAEYLQQSAREIAGIYIQKEVQFGEAEVQLDVDFIFPARTEKQRYRLVKEGKAWKISDIQNAEYREAIEEYGAYISELIPGDEAQGEGD